MLWTIIVILLAIWLVGLLLQVGGFFVHVLLVAAAAVLIYQLLTSRRTA